MGEQDERSSQGERSNLDPIREAQMLCDAFMSVAHVVAGLAAYGDTTESNVARVLIGTLSTQPQLHSLPLWFRQREDDVPLRYDTHSSNRAAVLSERLAEIAGGIAGPATSGIGEMEVGWMPRDFLHWAIRRGFDEAKLRAMLVTGRERAPKRLPTWEEVLERKYGGAEVHDAMHRRDALKGELVAAKGREEALTGRMRELEAELAKARANAAPAGRWPWGNYETELLRQLAAAAEHWWVRFDPEDETTAPKNNQVAGWLEERNVAQRNAQAIASLLRADGLRTGPR